MHAGPARHVQHVSWAEGVQQHQPGSPDQQHDSSQYASSSSNTSPARSDLHATIIEPMHMTVPLSSVPTAALRVSTAEEKAQKLGRASHGSTVASTAVSSKTGRFSQMLDAEKEKAQDAKLRMNRPRQVTGRATNYHTALAWAGRIGWCGKAVVYAMIGGLACKSAVGGDRPDPSLPTTEQIAASPQGAFVLLGTTAQGIDIVILVIMLLALVSYITWRFWEGLAGQGYDETFSSKKNFFKFRVSPIVSGCVYVSYMVFLISVIKTEAEGVEPAPGPQPEGWPATWRHSAGGRVGLALLGIAFCIATCIQLQGVLTRQWHRDYRSDLPRWLMVPVFTIGHFGFAGRAGAFLAMAIMFLKDAGGVDTAHDSSMVANALLQLQANRGLRAILMIVGILLIMYGLFATLSAGTRMFPTPPPSRSKRLPAAEFKEHERRKERRHRWGLPLYHRHGHNADSIEEQHPTQATGPSAVSGQSQPSQVPAVQGATHSRPVTGANGSIEMGPATELRYPPAAAAAPGSAGMATAASDASSCSIPLAVDESPGWGRDQGLGNSSLDLDQLSRRVPSRPGSAGQLAGTEQSWRSRFVMPSQRRPGSAASAAGAASTAGTAAEAPDTPPIGAGVQGYRATDKEFVTVDL